MVDFSVSTSLIRCFGSSVCSPSLAWCQKQLILDSPGNTACRHILNSARLCSGQRWLMHSNPLLQLLDQPLHTLLSATLHRNHSRRHKCSLMLINPPMLISSNNPLRPIQTTRRMFFAHLPTLLSTSLRGSPTKPPSCPTTVVNRKIR